MLKGKRQAIVSSADRSPAALKELVERAVAMARTVPEDPYVGLAEPDQLTKYLPDLDICDDTELAALDAQAEADGERASLEAELPVVRLALETATAAWSSVDAALAEESASLQERRTAAAAAIPAGDLGTYETSRRHHDGVAIARLEGHRCAGCHLDLSAAELDEVKSTPEGVVPECPQCGRFLVR